MFWWILLGLIALAALVGMTKETSKSVVLGDTTTTVTTYEAEDKPGERKPVQAFIWLVVLCILIPPAGICLVIGNLTGVFKRGSSRIEVRQHRGVS
jgi:uncharacterized membrane protein